MISLMMIVGQYKLFLLPVHLKNLLDRRSTVARAAALASDHIDHVSSVAEMAAFVAQSGDMYLRAA